VGDAPEPAAADDCAIGIDLGLKAFLVTSEGESVESPHYYRKAQIKLRRAQRSLSRKKKGSKRRRKARERVAKLHEKTANQRRDFHRKEARKLVERFGAIVHEALNVRGIARTRLAKSTHDAGWAQFLNILAAKAEVAGRRVIAVDPKNTTQACSRCGALSEDKKTLSVRIHICSSCGYVTDRDINAAKNIMRLGRSLQAQTYRVAESVA
jgi:putative transposase